MLQHKPILIVDDEENCLRALKDIFELEHIDCIATNSSVKALELFKTHDCDIVIIDVRMPGVNGIDLLKLIKKQKPKTYVIMLTSYSSIDYAVASIKMGAYDYIFKPVIVEDLLARINEIFTILEQSATELAPTIKTSIASENILIGHSQRIQSISLLISKIANTDLPVLILGESGSGKELAARMIHQLSNRAEKPFVAINCAALADTQLESELFGYEKGAFAEAITAKAGKMEQADGGTLFLDEIGELKISMQAKLLHALQEQAIQRLGSNNKRKIDIRLISANSKDLYPALSENTFRADLFYRINTVTITMPSLREIPEDIPVLAEHFAKEFSDRYGRKPLRISPEAMTALTKYSWPGNVRELVNTIHRAAVLSHGDTIREFDLPSHVTMLETGLPLREEKPTKSMLLEDIEKEHILKVLDIAAGNKSEAAAILGIHRDTLLRKLKKYHVE